MAETLTGSESTLKRPLITTPRENCALRRPARGALPDHAASDKLLAVRHQQVLLGRLPVGPEGSQA